MKEIKIRITVDENNKLNTEFDSSGFNSYEIVGILENTKQDVLKFIRNKTSKRKPKNNNE